MADRDYSDNMLSVTILSGGFNRIDGRYLALLRPVNPRDNCFHFVRQAYLVLRLESLLNSAVRHSVYSPTSEIG